MLGKTYLINFWGTYCPPCRFEHPYLLELSKIKDIAVVGVNFNDDSSAAREWLKLSGDPFVMNISDAQGKLGIDMGVIGAPETFPVDENGIIRQKYIGILNDHVWKEKFVPLLN